MVWFPQEQRRWVERLEVSYVNFVTIRLVALVRLTPAEHQATPRCYSCKQMCQEYD